MEEKKKVGSDLIKEATGYPQIARALVVTNARELIRADEFVKGNKTLQKKIREWFKPHKSKARETLNGLIKDEKMLLDPLYEGERIAKGKMASYMEEQARIRREAEEAVRKAREEAEAAAKRAEEEAAAAVRAAEEERQRKAREALHDGEQEKAEEILEEETKEFTPEVPDIPPPVEIEVPEEIKLKGSHMRTTWEWELKNIDIVPRILPDGERPLKLDPGVITAHGVKHKDKAKIPGIRFFPKTGMAMKE